MAQDIGLLLRGLGASFANQVPQFRQEMAQEDQARQRQQELAGQQESRANAAQMQNFEMMRARQTAAFQDAESALKMGARGDWEGIIGLAEDRMNLDQQLGGPLDGDITPMLAEMARRAVTGDPAAANMALSQLTQVVAAGFDRGVLKRPQAEIIPGASIVDGQITTMDAQGNFVARRPEGFTAGPSAADQAEVGEARTTIRTNMNDINKSLTEITQAYDKVVSLEPEMRKGNRSAINAAIMNVARLISPGVVTDRDAAAFSGANTSIGAIFEFLSGKGVAVEDLIRIYDPANPNVFDPDALLNVARTVTGSAIPSLMARFGDQKVIANQYQLSPRFVASYLPDDSATMTSVRNIMGTLSGQSPGAAEVGSGKGTPTFRTVEEATRAVEAGRVPVGTVVAITGPDGTVTDTFVVEE